MRRERAGIRRAERQRQAVEEAGRSEPDVFVAAHPERRLERVGVETPHGAVRAVGADEEITGGVGPTFRSGVAASELLVRHARMEPEIDAELAAALVEDIEELAGAGCRRTGCRGS